MNRIVLCVVGLVCIMSVNEMALNELFALSYHC